MKSLAAVDPMVSDALLGQCSEAYLKGQDAKSPLASPLFADLAGLPPLLIHGGTAEVLLDDARRYVNKSRAAGSPARLQSWPGLLHVWQIFNDEVPEARDAIIRIGEFVKAVEAGDA